MRHLRPLLFAIGLFASAPPSAVGAQEPLPPTYSDSQAVRGRQWFASVCQSCHETTDMTSPDFKVKWSGRTAFDLFEIISTTMPEEEPGTLTQRTYVDIVAYLMQLNGIPAGTTALVAEQASLTSARLSFTPHAARQTTSPQSSTPHTSFYATPHSKTRR